jgi:5-methylcytosine-specific restriction endonuclease McrA
MRSAESILQERYGDDYKEILLQEYVTNVLTMEKIGKKYSVSRNAIKRILVNMGVEIVPHSEMLKRWWKTCQGEDRQRMVAAAHVKSKELAEKGEHNFQIDWRENREDLIEKCRARALHMCKVRKRNGMTGRTGELHHNWNPAHTKEYRVQYRRTTEHRAWLRAVYERDNYTCQVCGYDKGGTLNAHHLYNYADYKELRHEVSNGVTLCKGCHIAFHDSYGYGGNTKEQFDVWSCFW